MKKMTRQRDLIFAAFNTDGLTTSTQFCSKTGLPKLAPLMALYNPPNRLNLVSRESEQGSCSDNEEDIHLTAKRISEGSLNQINIAKNSDIDPSLLNKDIFQQSGMAMQETDLKDHGLNSTRDANNTKLE